MGSLAVDIYRNEREYKHLTLSDENVVKYLILARSKIDLSYGANTNNDIYRAGDMFEFNQEIIALYASLDKVVEEAQFTDKEMDFLILLYEGNTIADTINIHKHYPKKTAYRTFNRIISAIVLQNLSNWRNVLNNTVLKEGNI